jgi:hypothetical protein
VSPGSLPTERALELAEPAADFAWNARVSTDRLVTWLCTSLVVCTVVCSRLALPLGAKQVPLVMPVAIAHLVAILVFTRGRIAGPRALATLGALAVVLFETVLVHRHTSALSLLYLVAIYAPLVVTTTADRAALEAVWRGFVRLAGVAAVLGLVQTGSQLVAGGYFPDPVRFLPEQLQLGGYQTTYAAMEGVLPLLKANGMLFVEPSAFSQFLALALLGELWWFRRPVLLGLLAAGLVVSFSGTGLMMLAAGLLFGGRVRVILLAGALGLFAAGILFLTGYGSAFTSRLGELQRPGTSGFERFVAPYVAMGESWRDSGTAVLWGYGAGRVEDLDTEYAANYSPIPKVFLEYGLVGLLGFAAVWLAMFAGRAVPSAIIGAMLVMYFVAAGSLLQPYTVFALWGLTAGFVPAAADGGAEEAGAAGATGEGEA